jgi:phospholipid/cholesterol/gamma-HCH transport system permease protein
LPSPESAIFANCRSLFAAKERGESYFRAIEAIVSATLSNTEDSVGNPTPVHFLGRVVVETVVALGDLLVFAWSLSLWLMIRLPRRRVLWPILYEIGVRSAPVVCITGLFIGMVLAVQTYDSLSRMHFENQIGAVINGTLVKELGPVLAAVMLAGRVGSAIAAQIGTMKISEQIEALRALGADPIAYLVVPRFLACVFMIPALTMVAEGVGIFGGWFVSTEIYGVNKHFFWDYADRFISAFDVLSGVLKSMCFGAAIAVIACHRGFRCKAGAEGVGLAATEAFVSSFVAILVIDFILALVIIQWLRLSEMLGITLM